MRRRSALLAIACFLASAFGQLTAGENPPKRALWIEIGGERAVLARHSKSADGRNALAWTVSDAAVDWAMLESDPDAFYAKYDAKEIWVVDVLEARKLAVLGGAGSYLRPGGQRTLSVAWGPRESGARFALAAYDWKWGTDTLFLLRLTSEGCTQTEIGKKTDETIVAHIQQASRKQEGPFDTQYLLTGLPEAGKKIGFSGHDTIGLPFSTRDRQRDKQAAAGVLVLTLLPGPPAPSVPGVKVVPGPTTDDPFKDATRLARADKELNDVYAAVRRQLDAASQVKLRDEQRTWIEQREEKADDAVRAQGEAENPRIVRDQVRWKLTEERTAQLRQKLKPRK